MNSRKRIHRISIQSPNGTSLNAVGEEVPVYIPFKNVWASINSVKRRSYSGDNREDENLQFFNFSIRYQSGLKEEMRIIFNNRIFEIRSIDNPEERNKELEILCYEVKA